MDKQSINNRLIDQYLSGPDGLGRLYREREKGLSTTHARTEEDNLPEVNAQVLELAREAGAEIARRQRRRFYVPMALAASALVAVVAVKVLLVPAVSTPDVHLLGSETPAQTVTRIQDLIKKGRPEEAAKALAELRQQHPDYPIPAELQSLKRQ